MNVLCESIVRYAQFGDFCRRVQARQQQITLPLGRSLETPIGLLLLQLALLKIVADSFNGFLKSQQSLFGSRQLKTGGGAVSFNGFQLVLAICLQCGKFENVLLPLLQEVLTRQIQLFRLVDRRGEILPFIGEFFLL